MKKITVATFKSFVRKNADNLFVNVKSRFDGMTDGIECRNGGFEPARRVQDNWVSDRNLGFSGISLTGSTKNWVEPYQDEQFTGFRVDNCCGSFIVAIRAA
jgi:hypothetical protein